MFYNITTMRFFILSFILADGHLIDYLSHSGSQPNNYSSTVNHPETDTP